MQLIVANKRYSSWSMRPWVLLKHFGIAFEECNVWLAQPDSREQILRYSPTGKVPCLIDNGITVWDSLSICEYLAESYPHLPLWPAAREARAHARSICAEMHSGFGALRNSMFMNVGAHWPGAAASPETLADARRIEAIWEDCLARYDGPFLFGDFTIADAFYAPVVMRFATFEPALSAHAQAYADRIREVPAVQAWVAGGKGETQRVAYYESRP
ncbi:Stringent starvation protein A [Pandoraea pneumonica]|jgi:glutathione S-transferase|uniref:Stringent starvation protein A n=1 Tax=Pandoraea pneumonica TaxID=2508299 RepID=A0A5E4V7K1_9BURK|nr:glutathione S-transferase family protein [Pandoraea pneumonica]VVE06840.1 Stringent starvation protein A [Pandoraea pneumonica]